VVDVFRSLDASGEALLTKQDFRRGLQLLGLQVAPRDVDALFDSWDVEESGVISLVLLKRILNHRGNLPVPAKANIHGVLIRQEDIFGPQASYSEEEAAYAAAFNSQRSSRGSIRLPSLARYPSSVSRVSPQQREIMGALAGGLEDFAIDFHDAPEDKQLNKSEFRAVLQQIGARMDDRQMEDLFAEMDANRSAFVTVGQLRVALRKATDAAMQRVGMERGSTRASGDGVPDLLSGSSALSSSPNKQLGDALVEQAKRVMELFTTWDADGGGSVTLAEFVKGVEALGVVAPESEFKELFNAFDVDLSGGDRVPSSHGMPLPQSRLGRVA